MTEGLESQPLARIEIDGSVSVYVDKAYPSLQEAADALRQLADKLDPPAVKRTGKARQKG